MTDLATTLLSNALLVVPLTLLVVLVTRVVRHPGIAWGLWGLVLLKFLTPAVWSLPIDLPMQSPADFASAEQQSSRPGTAPNEVDTSTSAQQPTPRAAGNLPVVQQARDLEPAATSPHAAAFDLNLPAVGPLVPTESGSPAATVPAVISTQVVSGDLDSLPPHRGGDDSLAGASAAHAPIASDKTTVAATSADAPQVAPRTLTASNETRFVSGASTAASGIASLTSRIPYRPLGAVWIIGSAIAVTIAVVRIVRFRRLLARAAPADAATFADAAALAAQLQVRRVPDIRLADGCIPPLLYGGVRRAVILLPRKLLATLDAESRRTLLAHELAHIARRDHWTRWLELLVRCLYWWHPLAWYAGRRLRDAEEQCCDARVVALLPDSAAAYARTILTTVDYLAGNSHAVPTLATGLQPLRRSVRPLHRRLTMIVEHKPTVRLSWPSRLVLVALAACILPISLMAQSEETPDEVGDRPASVAEVSDAENDADTAATQSPPVYFDVATGTVVYANDPELRRAGGIDVLAQSKTDSNDATAEPADDDALPGESDVTHDFGRLLDEFKALAEGKIDSHDNTAKPASDEQKLADLIKLYHKLMEQQRFAEAMVIARKAKELAPENPVVVQLEFASKFAYRNDRNKETRQLDDEEPATITVQRKSYAIQSAIGKSVVQLLEQMQRSGVVDPLFAQLGGHTAISEDGQSHDQPGVTVITTPAAHKVIGAFIDGLRELRPAPGQKGPAELEIRRVIYDWDASWDISRGLAGLLEEAVKMGHIGYVRIGSNKDDRGLIVTTDRMSITTTDPVHNVIGPFIEFLNEQQALQGAAAEGAPADSLAEPASDPSAYGSARALGGGPVAGEPQQDDGGRGRRSRLPSKPSPIAGEPQQVESRGGFGASRLGSGTSSTPAAASAKRPQVVTDAEELEEVTVVSREYKLDMQAVQQVREFLLEVRDGFRVLRLSDPLSPAPYPGPAAGGYPYGVDASGYAIPPLPAVNADGTHPGIPLRILVPAEAHAVLEGFLELFGPAKGEPLAAGEQEIVLVRTEYELPPTAAEKFAALLTSSEQLGLTAPLIVNRRESRVTVTAAKDVQEQIRRLITYLGENWQTAGLSQEDVSQPLKQLAGIELAPLAPKEEGKLGEHFQGGLRITSVAETAPLLAPGLRAGDVLVALADVKVTSLDQVRTGADAVRKGVTSKGVTRSFLIFRDGALLAGQFVPNDGGRSTSPTPMPLLPGGASRFGYSLVRHPAADAAQGLDLDKLRGQMAELRSDKERIARRIDQLPVKAQLAKDLLEVMVTLDLHKSRGEVLQDVLNAFERQASDAPKGDAERLRMIREVYAMIADEHEATSTAVDEQQIQETRQRLENELPKWGIQMPAEAERRDYFVLFTNYINQVVLESSK